MKIKEISFNQEYFLMSTQSRRWCSSKSVIHSSSFSNFKSDSPSLTLRSNKHLKFYFNRQKNSITTMDNINVEALKEEFSKFDDFKMKGFSKIDSKHTKEAINLMAKKYHTIYKTQSSHKIDHCSMQNKNANTNNQRLVNLSKTIIFDDDKLRSVQSGQLIKIQPLTSINLGKNTTQFSGSEFPSQNAQANVQLSVHQEKKLSISSLEQQNRKVLVPEERLHRHRFNKSSISKMSYFDESKVNNAKNDNFLSIDLTSSLNCPRKYVSERQSLKINKKLSNPITKIQASKRYVTVKEDRQSQDLCINPYSKKRYLHIQVEVDKKQLKTIEKMIQQSDPTNMKQSFKVATINPETNTILTSRTLNKTQQDGFMRKIKNLGTSNLRKQFKKQKAKTTNQDLNQIHGWEVDSKQITVDQHGHI